MGPERLRRALALFDRVVELSIHEQATVLGETENDPLVVREVQQMLARDRNRHVLLAAPPDIARPIGRVGGFELGALLGSGGMADVYAGQHIATGTPVAVKVIRPDRLHNDQAVRGFEHEIRVAASLDHPAAVWLFDAGIVEREAPQSRSDRLVEGTPYLVMERLSGGTLSDRVQGWRDVQRAACTLLDVLAHTHGRGVIHLDLKPGNILVAADGDLRPGLRVTDFGIAHAVSGRRPAQVAGTPAFMPPEQIRADWRSYGPWTDLYALGSVLWLLVTGRPPYVTPDLNAMLTEKLAADPDPLQPRFGVPDGLEAWLRALLAREPQARPSSAREAAIAFHELGEPAGVRPIAPKGPERAFHTLSGTVETGPPREGSAWAGSATVRLPADWRLPLPPTRPQGLHGAGLGLFGLRTPPMVGREPQRDALWRHLAETSHSGRARGVCLHGPRGAGCTRLAQWLCRRALACASVHVLVVTTDTKSTAAASLQHALIRWLRLDDLSRVDVAARLLSGRFLDSEIEAGWTAAALSPAGHARLELLGHIVRQIAAGGPLVVLLDGPARPDAEGLVRALLSRCSDRPLLLLLPHLPTQDLHLEEVLVPWLSDSESMRLLAELIGLDEALAARVVRHTGGNPSHMTQLVDTWVEQGRLVASQAGFRLADDKHAFTLVGSLVDVCHSRIHTLLDGLAPEARVCLETAATLGVRVRQPAWEAACPPGTSTVRNELIERLAIAGIARIDRDGSLVFDDHTMRQTIIQESIAAGRSASIHRRCAEVLGDLGARWPELLSHNVGAGDHRAAWTLLASGRGSELAVREYLAYLGDAERWLDSMGIAEVAPERATLAVLLSNARQQLASTKGAVSDARRAIALAEQCGDDRLVFRGLASLGGLLVKMGRLDEVETVHSRARALASKLDDDAMRGRLWIQEAILARYRGDIDTAVLCSESAVSAFEAAGVTPHTLADARKLLGLHLHVARNFERSARLLSPALGYYRSRGNAYGAGECLNALSINPIYTTDRKVVEVTLREAWSALDAWGSREAVVPQLNLAMHLLEDERHLEAASLISDARTGLRAQVRPAFHLVATTLGVVAAALQGAWAEAGEAVREAHGLSPGRFPEPRVHALLGRACRACVGCLDLRAEVERLRDRFGPDEPRPPLEDR